MKHNQVPVIRTSFTARTKGNNFYRRLIREGDKDSFNIAASEVERCPILTMDDVKAELPDYPKAERRTNL